MSQAKDKAEELVEKHQFNGDMIDDIRMSEESAIECALICVDEKQETIDKMFNGYYTMPKEWRKEYDELEEVKQEINKL